MKNKLKCCKHVLPLCKENFVETKDHLLDGKITINTGEERCKKIINRLSHIQYVS